MPAWYRRAGFREVQLSCDAKPVFGFEAKNWLAGRVIATLQRGEKFRQSWIEVGVTEEEIEESLKAVKLWADTEDAWAVMTQCNVLGWKSTLR